MTYLKVPFYLAILLWIMLLFLLRFFHRLQTNQKQNSPYMALKLDIIKAFDQAEWGFLEVLMKVCIFWIISSRYYEMYLFSLFLHSN